MERELKMYSLTFKGCYSTFEFVNVLKRLSDPQKENLHKMYFYQEKFKLF